MTRPRLESTVLLVADPPPVQIRSGGADAVERQEALISLARATLAAGGRVALPADAGVALLVGTIGLEYMAPPVAERRSERPLPPVLVRETAGPHEAARILLGPLVRRGAVEYFDGQGNEVLPPDFEPAALNAMPGPRQPVDIEMVRAVEPVGAVLISPARRALAEVAILRAAGVPVATLRNTAHDAAVEDELMDVPDLRDTLRDTRPVRWRDEVPDDRPRRPQGGPVPYGFVMQQIIDQWIRRFD